MNNILTLDCTLRDGGYCNKWNFGEKNIKKIISALVASCVDVIECGFLTNKVSYNSNITKYSELGQLEAFLPTHNTNTQFVVMMNYGEYDVDTLPLKEMSVVDGIRIAFHKKDRYQALELCKQIKEKGYKVYIQPMVSMLYSEQEFKELIDAVNQIEPLAFYIVDSFGMMNRKDLCRYFEIADKHLNAEIYLGFHSHNNLQSAFSNAQSIMEKKTIRTVIIDSSIYGMGRGAGNLNSELFFNELNVELGKKYEIRPLLHVMDEVLNRFYEENPWGYSLPNYLSAIRMIHPNYASFLSEKKTLALEDIDEIFSMIDPERGAEFDEKYIKDLYFRYMSTGTIKKGHLFDIKEKTRNRKILLIAPGKKAIDEQNIIVDFINYYHPVVISINHEYPIAEVDYVFVSNIRRFSQLDKEVYSRTINTSNIKTAETYATVDYYNLLNAVDDVRDNAGLMAIKFAMEELESTEIYLAGLDGYSHDVFANFETREMALLASHDFLDKMNKGMKEVIKDYRKSVDITFITTSLLN